MEMVKFEAGETGNQKFWVKNPEKIKFWRACTQMPQTVVRELKTKEY